VSFVAQVCPEASVSVGGHVTGGSGGQTLGATLHVPLHVAVVRQLHLGSSPYAQTKPLRAHVVPAVGGTSGHGDATGVSVGASAPESDASMVVLPPHAAQTAKSVKAIERAFMTATSVEPSMHVARQRAQNQPEISADS